MVSQAYPPRFAAGNFRVLRFARFLPEFGWECVVITPAEACHPAVNPRLMEQVNPATEVWRYRCGDPAEHLRKWTQSRRDRFGRMTRGFTRALGRLLDAIFVPDTRMLSVGRIRRTACRVTETRRVDAIWITGPPFGHFLAGPVLKRRFGIPLVLDLRDPWTTSPIRYGGRNGWKLKPERRMEARLFQLADRVVLNTHHVRRDYQVLYPHLDLAKWCVLPNTYDPEDFASVQPEKHQQRVFLHAGVSGGIRTAKWLIAAIGQLRRQGLVAPDSFRYVSYGPGGRDEHEAAAAAGVRDMVEFRGARPHQEVLSAMKGADVLVLLVGRGHEASIPSKLYEYLAAGRPVLMAGPPDSAAAALVRETNVGPVVALDDTETLAINIGEMLAGRASVPNVDVIAAYQSRSVTRSLADTLNNLVGTWAMSGSGAPPEPTSNV